MTLAGPDDPPPAPRRRGRRRGLGLLLVAAVVGLATLLLRQEAARRDAESEGTGTSASNPRAATLDRRRSTEASVPVGAVDVEVVEWPPRLGLGEGGAAPDVEARLVTSPGAEPGPEGVGRTGAKGRVRLRGSFPAFVEIESDDWSAASGRTPVDERTSVQILVTRRRPLRVEIRDGATGASAPSWTIGAADGESAIVATTGPTGAVSFPRRRGEPSLLAATDGRQRAHVFLLHDPGPESDLRLDLPPATNSTLVRVLDDLGAPIPGASVGIGSDATGVFLPVDDRGEVRIEHGGRAPVPILVTAPGRFPRAARLDAREVVVATLLPTATRRVALRRADLAPFGGREVRVRGFTRGPDAYGLEGAGRPFAATADADGLVALAGLPAGPFEALLLVEGPGLLTLVRVRAAEGDAPIDVVVGPARVVRLLGIPARPDGRPGLATVRIDGRTACGTDVGGELADHRAAIAGRLAPDPLASLRVLRGPAADVEVPRSTEPRRLDVRSEDGAYACLVVAPDDPGGERTLRFEGAPREPAPVMLRLEGPDGVVWDGLAFEATPDERDGVAVPGFTDSAGRAALRLGPGRWLVTASTADGTRFAGEAPVVVPAVGPPGAPLFVRLRPVDR